MGGEIYGPNVETYGNMVLSPLIMWVSVDVFFTSWRSGSKSSSLKVGRVDCARTIRVEQVEGFSDFIYLILWQLSLILSHFMDDSLMTTM